MRDRLVRSSLRAAVAAVVLGTVVMGIGTAPASAHETSPGDASPAVLAAGFADVRVAQVFSPTAVAGLPDGRVLITSQLGQVRVLQGTTLLATPALDLTKKICSNGERGVLGITPDPAFTTNHFVYVFYTLKKFPDCDKNTSTTPVNRISRFTLGTNNVMAPASEKVILDNLPTISGMHNSGDIHFGADGFLYASVGDSGCKIGDPSLCFAQNPNARRLDVLVGKILRITKDGGIPAANPFVGKPGARRCGAAGGPAPGTGPCTEIFATGLRNPFRFAFKPGTNTFNINDVGQDTWEEIDRGKSGADYGWNIREGRCATGQSTGCTAPPAGMTDPIFAYNHTTGCESITGGAFVPTTIGWPAPFNGAYLYSDYVCGHIVAVANDGAGPGQTILADNLGVSSAVAMAFVPFRTKQALYYTTYANGGEVRRITYSNVGNLEPTAQFTATPDFGTAPLDVTFDASASSDPEKGALQYHWVFGDGATADTTSPTIHHVYTGVATRTPTLTVKDPQGLASSPATGRIDVGNTPPSPQITAPLTTTKFHVGTTYTLKGTATDKEDGTLAASTLTWTILLHHDAHTHPFLGPVTGTNISFVGPPPEDLVATKTSFLEIILTATDSKGRTSTIHQNFNPLTVGITLKCNFDNVALIVNGNVITSQAGGRFITSWAGWVLHLNAPNQVVLGQPLTFVSWSDGGAQAHSVVTPNLPKAFTATFKQG